ncbi:unnamed protein product, partial [marine sediment metagenome]
ESILELSSYHVQIHGRDKKTLDKEILSSVERLKVVRSIVPFTEHQVIAEGRTSNPRGCLIRGLPPEVTLKDPSFMNHLDVVDGDFDLHTPGSIVLGTELARQLGVAAGDTVTLIALDGQSFDGLIPIRQFFLVTGLFKSGYYEFDLGWAFVSLDAANRYFEQGRDTDLRYGIKIQNRFKDQAAARQIEAVLNDSNYQLGTWREFNRAFFGALLMEKILMMVLIGLIFIVVGFNIYHTLRRTVRERYEEIGVLKALGASNRAIQYIFVLDGLLIGL